MGRLLLALVMVSFAFRLNDRPTLHLIGDSTVRNYAPSQKGWGDVLTDFFDTSRIEVRNHAMPGRSTRTFLKEGRWHQALALMKTGDYLLIQFGHNDGARPDTTRHGSRGVLRGIGADSTQVDWGNGNMETVYTYGHYLTHFVREAKSKGVEVFICSPIPRNRWDTNGQVFRNRDDFGGWAKEVALRENVHFIALNDLIADQYDQWKRPVVDGLFGGDHTHTNEAGARINAYHVCREIQRTGSSLAGFLQ